MALDGVDPDHRGGLWLHGGRDSLFFGLLTHGHRAWAPPGCRQASTSWLRSHVGATLYRSTAGVRTAGPKLRFLGHEMLCFSFRELSCHK